MSSKPSSSSTAMRGARPLPRSGPSLWKLQPVALANSSYASSTRKSDGSASTARGPRASARSCACPPRSRSEELSHDRRDALALLPHHEVTALGHELEPRVRNQLDEQVRILRSDDVVGGSLQDERRRLDS